jgi:hypothetical protein
MSILVRYTPTGLTAEQYDTVDAKVQALEQWPPDGLKLHVCFGEEGNLNVSEIWDSREQWQAFGEHLMPVLAENGIEAGEPALIPIHNIEQP